MCCRPFVLSLPQGFEVAKRATIEFLDGFKKEVNAEDRDTLRMVARTSLRTKLTEKIADQLTDIVTDAVLAIHQPNEQIDLFMVSSTRLLRAYPPPHNSSRAPGVPSLDYSLQRCASTASLQAVCGTSICVCACVFARAQVEIMHMRHKLDEDTQLIRGLVLDHGSRHPDMPKRVEGEVFILTCNISLEYEKSEVNSGKTRIETHMYA